MPMPQIKDQSLQSQLYTFNITHKTTVYGFGCGLETLKKIFKVKITFCPKFA